MPAASFADPTKTGLARSRLQACQRACQRLRRLQVLERTKPTFSRVFCRMQSSSPSPSLLTSQKRFVAKLQEAIWRAGASGPEKPDVTPGRPPDQKHSTACSMRRVKVRPYLPAPLAQMLLRSCCRAPRRKQQQNEIVMVSEDTGAESARPQLAGARTRALYRSAVQHDSHKLATENAMLYDSPLDICI